MQAQEAEKIVNELKTKTTLVDEKKGNMRRRNRTLLLLRLTGALKVVINKIMGKANPVIKEIGKWIDSYVKVRAGEEWYEGVLLGVDISRHGGIGNVYLKGDSGRVLLIRGSSIEIIALVETTQEKYNHQ